MTEVTFEEAYAKLETILEKISTGKETLDSSLKLFEEADSLISFCGEKLQMAETKIEMLIKQRGNLVLSSGKPLTEDFPA